MIISLDQKAIQVWAFDQMILDILSVGQLLKLTCICTLHLPSECEIIDTQMPTWEQILEL